MELVPHITLNPSFNIDMLEHIGEEDSRWSYGKTFPIKMEGKLQINEEKKLHSIIFSEHAFLVDHDGAAG